MRLLALLVLVVPIAAASSAHMAWDGRTAGAVCAEATACTFVVEPVRTWTEFAPGASSISGVLTYDAAAPALDVLHVYVMGIDANGFPTQGVEFTGVERIPFAVDLATLPGHHHALSIHGDHRVVWAAGAYALVEAPQDFRVELDLG